jgi:hypothetical protein
MSGLARTGAPAPKATLRPELAAYFIPPARPSQPSGRDCRHGILRELAEAGLIP